MNQSKALIFIILCTVFFISCTQLYWYKPNASQSDFEQDRYTCLQESAQAFPVILQEITLKEGYYSPSQTSCFTNMYGHTNCTTYPGKYNPPETILIDANKGNRNSAFTTCMNAKEWYLREVKE